MPQSAAVTSMLMGTGTTIRIRISIRIRMHTRP